MDKSKVFVVDCWWNCEVML